MVIILSIEDQTRILNLLPSTITVQDHTFNIKKVTQGYDLPDYVNPTLAIQYFNEFGEAYTSIDGGYTEIDEYTFSITKDYKTFMMITVAADNTELLTKSITYKYNGTIDIIDPYINIVSITPAIPVVGSNVTIVYKYIIKGYDICRAIMRAVYDLIEFGFPVTVVNKSNARDISQHVGREALCVLQSSFELSSEYTSVYTYVEENTPVDGVEMKVICNS